MVHTYYLRIPGWYVVLWLPLPMHAAAVSSKSSSFASQARANILQHHLLIATDDQQKLAALIKKRQRLQEALEQTTEFKPIWRQEFVRFDHEMELLQAKINETHARIITLQTQEENRRMQLLTITEKKARVKIITTQCAHAVTSIAKDSMDDAHISIAQAHNHVTELVEKRTSSAVITNCFAMYLEAEELWCITVSKKINHNDIFTKSCQEIFTYIRNNNLSQARILMSDLTDTAEIQQKKLSKQHQAFLKLIVSSLSLAWYTKAHINQELEESDHNQEVVSSPIDPAEITAEIMCRDFFQEELRFYTTRKTYYANKIQEQAHLKKELDDTNQDIADLQSFLATTTRARFASTPPASRQTPSPESTLVMPVVRAVLTAATTTHTKPAPKKTASSTTTPPSIKTRLRTIDLGKQTRALKQKPPRQPFHSEVFTFQRPIPDRKEEVH